MKNDNDNFQLSIDVAFNNAKERISILKNLDRKSVLDEYKEWFSEGMHKDIVLLIRDDPII